MSPKFFHHIFNNRRKKKKKRLVFRVLRGVVTAGIILDVVVGS